LGASETGTTLTGDSLYSYEGVNSPDNPFSKYKDITKNTTTSYAYFDLSYA
jgi:hypothetical protein